MNKNSESFRDVCHNCHRPLKACFCDELKPFDTYFEFCLLMHPKEAKFSHMGTGRMANAALINCNIIVGENFDNNAQVQKIIGSRDYFPMLLYPGETSLNLSKDKFSENYFEGRRPLLFILDGTWPCAKSMMRDSLCLHDLPRLSFDSSIESKFSIRQQPAKYCLSTIESIYQVLLNLERQGIEDLGVSKDVLPLGLEKLVEFQNKCATDPKMNSYSRDHGSYKEPEKRKKSKKWEGRSICFEDDNYK